MLIFLYYSSYNITAYDNSLQARQGCYTTWKRSGIDQIDQGKVEFQYFMDNLKKFGDRINFQGNPQVNGATR